MENPKIIAVFHLENLHFGPKWFLKKTALKLNERKPDDRIATVKKTKELYEFYSEKFYESITKFGISQNETKRNVRERLRRIVNYYE